MNKSTAFTILISGVVSLIVCLFVVRSGKQHVSHRNRHILTMSAEKPINEKLVQNRNSELFIYQQKNHKDYLKDMDYLNDKKVAMDDPRLINLIRNYWIENPSKEPYNLKFPDTMDPSMGQAAIVDNKLEFKEGGFYVECGALDGETRSNTLMLERLRKWNGLLIEADPANYALVKKKHRKAFTINACLSIYPYPIKMRFKQQFNVGQLVEGDKEAHNIIEVQCFPLYSILAAINITRVDFFSLDVEGAELRVLETVPFDKLDIDMMTVEFKHIIGGGENSLKSYVENKGYQSVIRISHYLSLANDIIFRKKRA